MVLADEINRTPPKTQSALLEAMQEFSVTVRGHHHKIERPFFVLATQNPIELEGTYPLPEAQLDRFLFNVLLDYLSAEDEMDVVNRYTTRMDMPEVEACTTPEQILKFQWLVRQVPVAESVQPLRRRSRARHAPERPERAGHRAVNTCSTARASARRCSSCSLRRRARSSRAAIT